MYILIVCFPTIQLFYFDVALRCDSSNTSIFFTYDDASNDARWRAPEDKGDGRASRWSRKVKLKISMRRLGEEIRRGREKTDKENVVAGNSPVPLIVLSLP